MSNKDFGNYLKQCISLTEKDNLEILVSFHQTSNSENQDKKISTILCHPEFSINIYFVVFVI